MRMHFIVIALRKLTPTAPRAVEFRKQYSWPDFNIKFIGVWDTVGALGIPSPGLQLKRFQFHDVATEQSCGLCISSAGNRRKAKTIYANPMDKTTYFTRKPSTRTSMVPGVHCNIGGGYEDAGLSDCALDWMWQKAELCGLAFDAVQKPDPDPKGVLT